MNEEDLLKEKFKSAIKPNNTPASAAETCSLQPHSERFQNQARLPMKSAVKANIEAHAEGTCQ